MNINGAVFGSHASNFEFFFYYFVYEPMPLFQFVCEQTDGIGG